MYSTYTINIPSMHLYLDVYIRVNIFYKLKTQIFSGFYMSFKTLFFAKKYEFQRVGVEHAHNNFMELKE